MRLILDTNILVSALILPGGPPHYLYQCWREGCYTLITSEEQLDEFRRVTRYPRLQKHIRPAAAGTMVNESRGLAELTGTLPMVAISPDPADNYLLAMAQHSHADYLVSSDERHLLNLESHERTKIVSARWIARLLKKKH